MLVQSLPAETNDDDDDENVNKSDYVEGSTETNLHSDSLNKL